MHRLEVFTIIVMLITFESLKTEVYKHQALCQLEFPSFVGLINDTKESRSTVIEKAEVASSSMLVK